MALFNPIMQESLDANMPYIDVFLSYAHKDNHYRKQVQKALEKRGLSVWAVDPADLDPRLADDPELRHIRTTAGEFLRATDQRYDLVVNDMRMDPVLSCRLMGDAAAVLPAGGLAVVTLKLGSGQPIRIVRDCLNLLAPHYDLEFARQLHHNRHEVTVVARRRAARR